MKNTLLLAGLLALSASPAIEQPAMAASPQPAMDVPQPRIPSFQFLRGHKQGRGRYGLQWNMTTNAGVQHFVVQATYEDPTDPYSNWYILGTVENSRNNIFRFTHSNMFPGIINYRVIAVMRDQLNSVTSPILTTNVGQ